MEAKEVFIEILLQTFNHFNCWKVFDIWMIQCGVFYEIDQEKIGNFNRLFLCRFPFEAIDCNKRFDQKISEIPSKKFFYTII